MVQRAIMPHAKIKMGRNELIFWKELFVTKSIRLEDRTTRKITNHNSDRSESAISTIAHIRNKTLYYITKSNFLKYR